MIREPQGTLAMVDQELAEDVPPSSRYGKFNDFVHWMPKLKPRGKLEVRRRIWTLWFVREPADGPDVENLLGLYSTEELANAARERAALLPRFNATPDDTLLVVDEPMDSVGWDSGFARVNY